MPANRERPLTIAILALGGQGGGVLTGWLVETALANGYLAQSTFVAGVAQRTGATVYCVEIFPKDRAQAIGKNPVFTAYPVTGGSDFFSQRGQHVPFPLLELLLGQDRVDCIHGLTLNSLEVFHLLTKKPKSYLVSF